MHHNVTQVRRAAWIILILAAALQAWMFRHEVSPDGVAYLDLSDSILSAHASGLVNGYWSPLYPAVVGLLRMLVSPTPLGAPYWEFALLHAVSLAGFVLSLAAFEWFLRALHDQGLRWRGAGDNAQPFSTPIGLAVAYFLFAVVSLGMISVAGTVPDFLVLAAVLATSACLLRLSGNPSHRATATRLGLVLAFGALSKSILFSLGVVVLLTLAVALWRRGGRAVVVRSALVFAITTLPWVVAVSVASGRLSFGQAGSLNYSWYVNDRRPPNTSALPALAAPREALPLSGLAVFTAARGTNPAWYDPARWNRDLDPTFSASQQWSRLSRSLRYYVHLWAPILIAFVVIAASAQWHDIRVTMSRAGVVLIASLAGLGAYALVYTTSRLVAPFVPAAVLAMAAAFPRDAAFRPSRLAIALALSLCAVSVLAPLRSMVMISFAFALFMTGWAALGNRQATVRWSGSLAVVLLVWAFPLLPPLAGQMVPFAIGLTMWLALSRAMIRRGTDAVAFDVRRAFAIGAVVASAIPGIGFGATALWRWVRIPKTETHPDWSTATRLIGSGVPSGARIAVLGNPQTWGWARLARYQIVAVVPDSEVGAFHALNGRDRARVMRAFSQVGATRLVNRPDR